MSDGTEMAEPEWEATRWVRQALAYSKVGLPTWSRLTDAQRDEAVRREAGGLDGADYARECVGQPPAPPAPIRGTGMNAQEFWRTQEVRVHLAARVGERYFCCLSAAQADEAVRREARADGSGEAYAWGCLSVLAHDLLRAISGRGAPSGA